MSEQSSEESGSDPNSDPIRRIFREGFSQAGLPYFNPHSFRKTLVALGEQLCPTPEAFKAWSQNLGHEQVLTTFTNYGAVAAHRQAEILESLRHKPHGNAGAEPDPATVQRVLKHLQSRLSEGQHCGIGGRQSSPACGAQARPAAGRFTPRDS